MPVVFEAVFSQSLGLAATFEAVIEVDKHLNPYPGPYTATPATTEQTLPTKTKVMAEDVTVTEIPYAETTNYYGTTVTIAS